MLSPERKYSQVSKSLNAHTCTCIWPTIYENGLNSIIKPSKTYKIFSIIFWVTTLTLHFLGSCNMYLLATVNFYFILLNGRQVKHPFLFLSQK